MCTTCRNSNHLKEVCRSDTSRRLYSIDPLKKQYKDEDEIDKVNINSIYIDSITLNSKHSVITGNLNISSRQATLLVSYKVGSGSDGNIITEIE